MNGDGYQLQFLHISFVPQVLPEVQVVHMFVDESEWVCPSRVHPHERHHAYIPVAKKIVHADLVTKPLQRSHEQRLDTGDHDVLRRLE